VTVDGVVSSPPCFGPGRRDTHRCDVANQPQSCGKARVDIGSHLQSLYGEEAMSRLQRFEEGSQVAVRPSDSNLSHDGQKEATFTCPLLGRYATISSAGRWSVRNKMDVRGGELLVQFSEKSQWLILGLWHGNRPHSVMAGRLHGILLSAQRRLPSTGGRPPADGPDADDLGHDQENGEHHDQHRDTDRNTALDFWFESL
jgi:hypothetical protein